MARTSPTNQFLTPGDGRKIAYKVYKPSTTTSGGSDRPTRPLVMIQGMSAVGTVDYDDLACELSKHGRTVVTLDNRDIGESTWTPAPSSSSSAAAKSFTLQDMAGDVIDLIRHLGYSEVDVLGHSMGGMIAQTLITTPKLPFKVRHCVLGATSAQAPRSDLGKALYEQMKKLAENAATDKRSKEEKDRETTEVLMRACYDTEWISANPKLFERRIQEGVQTRRPSRTVDLQQRAIGKYNVQKLLPSIPTSLRVLVIHGKRDIAVYPEEVDRLLNGIKHAKLAKCPRDDFGHNWYDYFDLKFWNSLLSDFLDDKDVVGSSKL